MTSTTVAATPRAVTTETIADAFVRTAAEHAAREAISDGATTLTYAELDASTNRIARALIEHAPGPGQRVGVHLERCLPLYQVFIGALKAGLVVVPFNPGHPAEHKARMHRAAEPAVTVIDSGADPGFTAGCLPVTDLLAAAAEMPAGPVNTDMTGESPAFILFTSGSTGEPKGVVIAHRGIARVSRHLVGYTPGPDDRFLQLGQPSFAASTTDIWTCLLRGGRLTIAPQEVPPLRDLAGLVTREKATVLNLPVGLFNLLVEHHPETIAQARVVIVSGDFPSAAHLSRALEVAGGDLFNAFGCTENSAEGVTTSMFFVALFFLLVHRHTRQDDVLLGMPVTVREGADAAVVGHLTNTVVLRHGLAPGATTRDVLRGVKREVLDVLRHRHAPLEAVVSDLRATGAHSGGDLFNAMITVMPATARRLDLRKWGVNTWEYTAGGAKYDLALVVDESPADYTLIVEHTSTSDDGEALAAHLARRAARLVQAMVAGPDTPVRDLDWLDEEEERAVTAVCARRAEAPTLGTELTADLFAAAAEATPDESAVVADGVTTTYAELAERVEAVASNLAARGVRDGQPVAVLMPPGLALVTTVLGILRAGGSYVTLDPSVPAERLSIAIGDCGATILVHDTDIGMSGVDILSRIEVLRPSDVDTRSAGPIDGGRKTPDDTAYIVYTSGSTGRPKGVVIAERTLANLAHCQSWLSAGRPLRTLQYMSPAFDVFALELVGAVCKGSALVVPPAHARTDFEALAETLAEQRIERVYLPYVALRELAAVLRSSTVDLTALREVYVTGERLVITEDLRAMFRKCPDARLINAYGPSEAHIVSADPLPADPDEWPTLPSIGRVVPGVDVRVLADGDRLAPFGVEGELCVAGPVVSPGYLNLPEKTAQAMVSDPFGPPGQRMYRTGDVVVLAPGGRLHYKGRADDQIKIRGYRVEPGEVEAALERVLGVEAAAVIVRSSGGDSRLHAFVQSSGEPPADWRTRLEAVLPGYMVPWTITRIDGIPVTPTGKTDRRALESWQDGAAETPPELDEIAGESGHLRAMAEVWTEVLGHAPTTPDDDFFVLGGHSLLAARLHRLVRQRFGTDVALSALLSTPTLRGMAKRIADGGAADPAAPPGLRADARLHDLKVAPRREEPSDDITLLTGATGFLGSHLLAELVATGRRVCCLVRADSVEDGRERVRRAFERFVLDTSRLGEVVIRPGDLSQPGFGLGAEYEQLARSVAEVYHAAAHINFVVPYHTVKRTNVDGLRHVLDFCGVNRTPLRLISTMGVFPPDSTSGLVAEDAVPGDPDSLGIGYSQSKWVGEHLALRARDVGLPVTLHRVGRIGGHSRTGACRHDDFFWLQMKSVAVLGRYPDDWMAGSPVDLLPVDYVARAIVRLSSGKPDNENWHLYHREGLRWPEIVETIRREGYDAEPSTRATWMAALEQRAESDGLGSLVPFMREGVMRLGRHTFDNEKTRRALADVGCPPPEADVGWLRGMFAYFRTAGAVPPPPTT